MILVDYGYFVDRGHPLESEERSSDNNECELPWWDGAMNDCNLVMQTFINQKNTTRSYCGKRADVIGKGQKVITYCLYGPFQKYASGLSEILETAQKLYPGWIVRLYTNPTKYTKELIPLLRLHTNFHICDVTNLPGNISDWRKGNSMVWRTAVMGDELVDVFLSRDIDAVMLDREVPAVKEFLKSGKSLHLMKDHHGHGAIVMGGMYGIRQTPSNRPILNSIREQLFAQRTAKQNNDQHLLKLYLYPLLKNDSISHASFKCKNSLNSHPWPTQRKGRTFVGNRRYRSDKKLDSVKDKCPLECRPPNHQDWEYC
ncbi:hypothetical protein FHG87_016096 [Trinorchestia longiramus]|nr:hypothetical protein FHG87_016096 [Trinorchestia longiramus]